MSLKLRNGLTIEGFFCSFRELFRILKVFLLKLTLTLSEVSFKLLNTSPSVKQFSSYNIQEALKRNQNQNISCLYIHNIHLVMFWTMHWYNVHFSVDVFLFYSFRLLRQIQQDKKPFKKNGSLIIKNGRHFKTVRPKVIFPYQQTRPRIRNEKSVREVSSKSIRAFGRQSHHRHAHSKTKTCYPQYEDFAHFACSCFIAFVLCVKDIMILWHLLLVLVVI